MAQTLATEALSKSYHGRDVVRDVSINIHGGEVVGLLGPNGAGKTTTFSCVLGLVAPDSGRVLLNGDDITQLPMYQRARRGVGYLPQEASIFRKMTVEQNLLAILETMDIGPEEITERTASLLAEFGISRVARQRASTLSGGERRRLEIARALTTNPSFILLDEPFAGIDPKARYDLQRIIDHLKQKGLGILVTDHNVRETLQITDRAYIIRDGAIFQTGTPEALVNDPEVRDAYLGTQFTLG